MALWKRNGGGFPGAGRPPDVANNGVLVKNDGWCIALAERRTESWTTIEDPEYAGSLLVYTYPAKRIDSTIRNTEKSQPIDVQHCFFFLFIYLFLP